MKKLKERIKNKLGPEKTEKLKKALNAARIIKNVICWILVAVLTLAIITFMVTKFAGNTPTVFGYSLHRVSSGSMEPELTVSDVIINREIKSPDEIKIGDIITFQGDSKFDNNKVTHRVLVAPYDNGKGSTVLVTKGDANEADDGEINFSSVESKYIGKVDFLRSIYNFFFSQWGLIVFILLLALIFFDEITNIIKLIVNRSENNETETIQQIIERVQREQLENAEKQQHITDQIDLKSDDNEPIAVKQDKVKSVVESKKSNTREQKSHLVKEKKAKEKPNKGKKNKEKPNQKSKKQLTKKSKSNKKRKPENIKNYKTTKNVRKQRKTSVGRFN